MNNVQKHIIREIRRRYGRVDSVLPAGWHFMFNRATISSFRLPGPIWHAFAFPISLSVAAAGCGAIRRMPSTPPTAVCVSSKAMTLENGAVAINYDFHVFENHCVGEVVARIVRALDYAAGFFEERVNGRRQPK